MTLGKHSLGYLGECHVRLELAKRGIRSIGTNSYVGFDLLAVDMHGNSKRIEVKSSRKRYASGSWIWSFGPNKGSDFVVGVGFDIEVGTENNPVFFVFPKLARPSSNIGVPCEDKIKRGSKYRKFLGAWDLIVKDGVLE